jgi:Bacterial membrane protein YfhO
VRGRTLAPWRGRERDALALVVLVAFVAAVFHRAILTSDVFYQRDIHSYWYPHVEAFVRALSEGSTPLWNPYDGFGAPLLANPATQVVYPPTWLNLLMQPATYYKFFVVGHTAGAGVGVYYLARALGLGRLSALLGGGAFCLSGPVLSSASLFHHFAAVAWMPWVLLAVTRLLARPRLESALGLAAALAAQLLAGSADVILMTGMASLVIAASLRLGGRSERGVSDIALPALLAAALGVGVAAVQWLPTAVEVTEGWRLRFSPETNLYWSMHPASLLDLLVPGLVAQFPMRDGVRATLFESRDPLLASVYLGAAATYVALVGLLMHRPLRRGALLGFLLFGTCALGRHAFMLPWLLHVPGFGVVRYPQKYLWGASLFFSLLAAGGAFAWSRPWSEGERRTGAWAGLLMALLAAATLVAMALVLWAPDRLASLVEPGRPQEGTLSATARRLAAAGGVLGLTAALGIWRARREEPTRPMVLALALLVLGDLAYAGLAANPLAPAELMAHRAAFVEKMERGSRVHVMAPPLDWLRRQLVRGPAGWPPAWSWTLGGIDLMTPPMGARWGLRGSYDGDFTGLAPRAYSELVTLARAAEGSPLGRLLLERGGVNYAVTLREGSLGGLQETGRVDSVFATPLRLLRVPDPLPPAYVVERVRAVTPDAALRAIPDAQFDIRREALVGLGEPEAAGAHDFHGAARVVERRSDSLVIEADLNRPGLLVVLEAFRPGWHVEVEGTSVPVLRVNAIFRGVRLGPGRHRLRMVYRPWAALSGAAISVFSLLAWLGLWDHCRRRGGGRGSPLGGHRPSSGAPQLSS